MVIAASMLSLAPAAHAQNGTRGVPLVLARLAAIQTKMNARIDVIQNQINALNGTVTSIKMVQADIEENTATHPMDMDINFCFKLGGKLGAETALKLGGSIEGKGGVGADIYGNGADADLIVSGDVEEKFKLGGEGGISGSACVKGWTVKSGAVLTAAQQAIVDDLKYNAEQIRNSVVGITNAFNVGTGKMISAMTLVQNVDLSMGNPAKILNTGAGAFGGMANALPLNAAIGEKLDDPGKVLTSLSEKLADPNGTLCGASLPPKLAAPFDAMCEGTGKALAVTIKSIHVAVGVVKSGVDSIWGVVSTVVGWVDDIKNIF
jgi:hypothetical protein